MDEAELVRRAHWLIELVEPADAHKVYAQVPRQCRTPGCNGKVSLALALETQLSLAFETQPSSLLAPDAPLQRERDR